MELTSLTNSTQLQEALAQAGNKTVVVDFTATWCAPCKKIGPVLRELAAKNSATFRVFTADVDVAQDLVSHFKVSSMPTFIFFRGNKVLYVLKGASAELLTQAFEIIDSITSQ